MIASQGGERNAIWGLGDLNFIEEFVWHKFFGFRKFQVHIVMLHHIVTVKGTYLSLFVVQYLSYFLRKLFRLEGFLDKGITPTFQYLFRFPFYTIST